MSRIDKYNPINGGFRAFLAADLVAGDVETLIAVGLDATGKVVKGGGQTGIVGVICPTRVMTVSQAEPVDVMTSGEIVEFPSITTPAPAGTVYYGKGAALSNGIPSGAVDVAANIAPGTAGPTSSVRIGHTVETKTGRGARLIVRVQPLAVATTGT